MAKKNTAPAPDINTNSTYFRILSWSMGLLCIPISGIYFWTLFDRRANGSWPEVILGILYLVGANIILPPSRLFWQQRLGISLQGRRLIYIYIALFMLIMGMVTIMGMVQQSRNEQEIMDRAQAEGAPERKVTRTPVDSLLAPAKSGLFWGYVNTRGEWVISPKSYDKAEPFVNGVARVEQGGKVRYINHRGEDQETKDNPNCKTPVSLSWKTAEKDGQWGWQDSTGRWAVEPQYDEVGAWGRTYNPCR